MNRDPGFSNQTLVHLSASHHGLEYSSAKNISTINLANGTGKTIEQCEFLIRSCPSQILLDLIAEISRYLSLTLTEDSQNVRPYIIKFPRFIRPCWGKGTYTYPVLEG